MALGQSYDGQTIITADICQETLRILISVLDKEIPGLSQKVKQELFESQLFKNCVIDNKPIAEKVFAQIFD